MAGFVAVDTNVCVWGIKKENDRDDLIRRCGRLFQIFDEQNVKVIIPAPVIGELLVAVPPTRQQLIADYIEENFRVEPYDKIAAEAYAEMMYTYYNNNPNKDYNVVAGLHRLPRCEVKVDHMIAAIARVKKVECLYTDDNGLKNFASPYMMVSGIPTRLHLRHQHSGQMSLFELNQHMNSITNS